jgi:tetratricopeptide (TPR) repeat protein
MLPWEELAMAQQYRSRRAELADLRNTLQAKGVPLRQIALAMRSRYNLNSRAAYRHALGLTQQQVAEQWNSLWPAQNGEPTISHKHISYWESWPTPTGRMPSLADLNRLARIYRCNASDLTDGEDHTEVVLIEQTDSVRSTGPPSGRGVDVYADPDDVVARLDTFIAASASSLVTSEAAYHQLVEQLIEWATRMRRREVLQWLSWAASAAAVAPVFEGLEEDEQQRVAQTIAAPARVDNAVVEHVEAVLWRCMRQDDMLGPQAALDTVLAQRHLVRRFIPEAAGPLGPRVLSLYANLSRFAGWLAFDLNNFDAASDYYEAARAAAHEAHDTALGAFVLCNMSHLATWRGQPRIGIDHAIAALSWANQTGDFRLKAYAHDVAARAFAMDRQAGAADTTLDQAYRALADADDNAIDTHVYFYDYGQLASTASVCHLYLGRAEQGIEAGEQALKTINGPFVRNVALASLRLGHCYLRATRPDVGRAAEAILGAAQLSVHNRSARLAHRLRRAASDLRPWAATPEVTTVRNQLRIYGID